MDGVVMEWGRQKRLTEETKDELEISKLVTMNMMLLPKENKNTKKIAGLEWKGAIYVSQMLNIKGLVGQPGTHQAG